MAETQEKRIDDSASGNIGNSDVKNQTGSSAQNNMQADKGGVKNTPE